MFQADWKEGFKKKQVGVADMTLLTTISNESINDNLQKRWMNGEIYTYIGGVLISVNPFRGSYITPCLVHDLTPLRSGNLYRGYFTQVSRQEQARGPTSRICHR